MTGADHSFGTVEERTELFSETIKFFKKIVKFHLDLIEDRELEKMIIYI